MDAVLGRGEAPHRAFKKMTFTEAILFLMVYKNFAQTLMDPVIRGSIQTRVAGGEPGGANPRAEWLPGAPVCSQPVEEQVSSARYLPSSAGRGHLLCVAGGYQGPTVCISFRGGSAQ